MSEPRGPKLSDDAGEAPAQIAAVHKDAVDNLMFLKRQQWQITNYAVAIQAGVLAFGKDVSHSLTTVLMFLAFAAAVGGFMMIWTVQWKMAVFRDRLHWIYLTYFTAEQRAALRLDPARRTFWANPEIPIALSLVCFAGLFLVCVLLP